jgi:sugar phosphate isomerase/epimerase
MKVGLIHFMAYPFAMSGDGDIVSTVRRVCADDYFDAIEVTTINDPAARAAVKKMADVSGISMVFGAQPRRLRTKQNINDLDEEKRLIAVANLKEGIDIAAELGCTGFGFLSGKYEEATKEESFQALVKSTVEVCKYAKEKANMPVNLEVFDFDIDKSSLIGPAPLAARFAEEVNKQVDNFGLMVDLSHVPILHESIRENLIPVPSMSSMPMSVTRSISRVRKPMAINIRASASRTAPMALMSWLTTSKRSSKSAT